MSNTPLTPQPPRPWWERGNQDKAGTPRFAMASDKPTPTKRTQYIASLRIAVLCALIIAVWVAPAAAQSTGAIIEGNLTGANNIGPLNPLVWLLAFPAAFLAASYPFTKRFLAIPQAYLGIAFGFGIPMAFAAQLGSVPAVAWWLLAANMFWSIAYDTEYAMVDREDDLRIGIKTSAITFGRFDLAAIAICYAATLGLLGWVGVQRELGAAFYGGLAVATAIALYHMMLIRQRDPQQCFRAFLHNTWFGAAVFGGLALHFLLK